MHLKTIWNCQSHQIWQVILINILPLLKKTKWKCTCIYTPWICITKIHQQDGTACILNNQFSRDFSVDQKTSPNDESPKGGAIHDINITKEWINKLLKNLALSKASRTGMLFANSWKKKKTDDEVVLVLESLHQATNIPDEWQDTIVTLQYLKVGIRTVIRLGTRHQSALNQEHVKIWHIYFAATYFLFQINRENWRENWKMFNIGFKKMIMWNPTD